MKDTTKILIAGNVIAIVVITILGVLGVRAGDYERRARLLEPMAVKYEEICGGVRATLYVDRQLLRNVHDREIILGKFGGSCGDDGFVMLERCLPKPFPRAAWDACVERHDDECLAAMLKTAEESLP